MQGKRAALQARIGGQKARVYRHTERLSSALERFNRQQKGKGGSLIYEKDWPRPPRKVFKATNRDPFQASLNEEPENQRQHRLLRGWPLLRRSQEETKPYRTNETPKHSSWGGVYLLTRSLVKGLFRRRETALRQQPNPDRQRPVVAMVPIGSTL